MEALQRLYQERFGHLPRRVEKLAGAGSNRQYFRLYGTASVDAGAAVAAADSVQEPVSVIGCVGTSRDENHAFLVLSRHFAAQGLPVPTVLAASADERCYLQTDLGATSLFDRLQPGRTAGGRYSEAEQQLLVRTIRQLPRLQVLGGQGADWSVCYPQPEFDATNVLFDLNYFKYCFLKATGIDFHEVKLEHDFRQMATDLTADADSYAFMYRDFQARNVMITPGEQPFFIDYQGGRRGPVYYDVASFLWQASARYPASLRERLQAEYYDALCEVVAEGGSGVSLRVPDAATFAQRLQPFVLFRTLQVLGAYGFRGYFERKDHFLQSIPPALSNLQQLLSDGAARAYPCLQQVLQSVINAFAARQGAGLVSAKVPLPAATGQSGGKLVVRVFSFSYKKGIPSDESGNGGGYVFDCRSTHNPGRYEPYKQLTGLDEPVIRFLEDDGEITRFLESVYRLADAHVERYLQRGFTSLMFAFGCTGGQHRSVYSAQHLAERLHRKYGIEVRLCHREQGISQTFPRR